MSSWTCSLGWFRFTVSDSTADEVIARVGGEWIKDKKGFQGYRPVYESQTWLFTELEGRACHRGSVMPLAGEEGFVGGGKGLDHGYEGG